MIIYNPVYIKPEDFPEEFKEAASILANNLNPFIQQIYDLANKRINFDNKEENLIQFEVTVNSSGTPIGNSLINVQKINVVGIQVIRSVNLTNPAIFPTSQPFISYDNFNNGSINIKKVSGLPAGKHRLTAIIY